MKTLKETVVRYDTAKLAVSLGFEDTDLSKYTKVNE